MLNPPIFPHLLVLMYEGILRVLAVKIFNGSGVMSLQIWSYGKKSILVSKFAFSNVMVCNSRTIENLNTKTPGEASHISASNM